MIELGLGRISRLLQQTPLSWKAIHIAGTNGKGSISAYLSHMLTAGGVRCGRFTSPHLIDRWDCITIGESVVQESLFRQIEERVRLRDQSLGIGASEFELLTATAFEIFNHEHVEVGVVEVGMGGRLDATNVLSDVLVSVIAKIGLDHQAFLGDTLELITREKAGILKPGIPCVVDGTNAPEVIRTLEDRVNELKIDAVYAHPDTICSQSPSLGRIFRELDLQRHQRANMCCAVSALRLALAKVRPELEMDMLLPSLKNVEWPGRLQKISLSPLTARKEPVLLDGAHNSQSAEVLGEYVDKNLRPQGNITWVIAASRGKDVTALFHSIVKSGDKIAITAFGPVDGMPWVKAADTEELALCIQSIPGVQDVRTFGEDVLAAINWACTEAGECPLVIAGSLYLVSDVHRLLREARKSAGNIPGSLEA
ncbi:probable dihydrofolate synthetase [Aspergillus lentulus]|uniref:dihydrofolate synthase n=1 Tax=Aspergillus lentulus TaxID=293939 RepID=UPI0013958DE5|nr:probable dihydrofolate synthetase [Aspergillus lentulus]GFF25287.1 probable dihydrofolate synthetase [Aspergillus lentulus]GFF85673.1 probable dihydrofolate synthetase [Aspergillus lentulus]GFG00135.1 probable dihydrofolate synthetase [Aspergillus lentulus]